MRYLLVMKVQRHLHNLVVAAVLPLIVLGMVLAGPAFGESEKLEGLFQRLKTADAASAMKLEQEIWIEWSKSGSATMDLLLERGREATAAGELTVAVEHLTALIDHAPEFAEGWNARATAYYQEGQIGPALSDIGHVLTLNPRHFGALSGLAMIFEELGRKEQALRVWQAVLAIHPHAQGVTEAIARLQAEMQGRDI